MADTAEMVRLMKHAAELLKAADPTPDYLALIYEQRNVPARDRSVFKLSQVIAAMTYARVLLDTVAAAMGEDPIVEHAPEPDLVALARQEARG